MKHRIWIHGLLLFFLISFTPTKTVPQLESSIITHHLGVLGGMVMLPCNITPPLAKDELELVLWYKETIESPVYSTDARMESTHEPKHFVHNMWDSRAYFNMFHKPTGLQIVNLKLEDAGIYKCRVDFKTSRTVYFRMTLDIAVPPSTPLITDEKDEIISGRIGPVPEGVTLTLKCETSGGNPKPSLKWFVNSVELVDIQSRSYGIRTESHLLLDHIDRSYANANITCKAINNNISNPPNTSVVLLLYVKPLKTQILHRPSKLQSGNSYKFMCESKGSNPPPVISWWKENKEVKNTHTTISLNKSISTSVIEFIASPDDNYQSLVCSSRNTRIKDSYLNDSITLIVHYKPELKINMKSRLVNMDLYEGDDVEFECSVKANPKIMGKIRWYHEEKLILEKKNLTSSKAIIINNSSLQIASLRFHHSGNYRCTATNSQGTASSKNVTLNLSHSPICTMKLRKVYATTIGNTVKIFCQVRSKSMDLNFKWYFNSSTLFKPLKKYTVNGLSSTLMYTPNDEAEFGKIMCLSENTVGPQKEPCEFTVIRGKASSVFSGRPREIRGCSVRKHDKTILLVRCDKSHIGSSNQTYIMEVYDKDTNELLDNITKTELPVFAVSGLSMDTNVLLKIYAFNKDGRSQTNVITIEALRKKGPKNKEAKSDKLQPVIGAIVGLVVSMIFIAISIVLIIKCRKPTQDEEYRSVTLPTSNSSLASQKHSKKPTSNRLENGNIKKNIASIMAEDGGSSFWDYCVSSLDSNSPQIRENALPLEHSSVYFKRKSRLRRTQSSENDKTDPESTVLGCEIPLMMKSTVEISL